MPGASSPLGLPGSLSSNNSPGGGGPGGFPRFLCPCSPGRGATLLERQQQVPALCPPNSPPLALSIVNFWGPLGSLAAPLPSSLGVFGGNSRPVRRQRRSLRASAGRGGSETCPCGSPPPSHHPAPNSDSSPEAPTLVGRLRPHDFQGETQGKGEERGPCPSRGQSLAT